MTDNSNQRKLSPTGGILIGVGIGTVVTGTTAYFIGRSKVKRARAEAMIASRKAQRKAYMTGLKEASERAQEWIDQHVMVIDADNPEDAQQKIDAAFAETAAFAASEDSEESTTPDDPSSASLSPDINPVPPQKTCGFQ